MSLILIFTIMIILGLLPIFFLIKGGHTLVAFYQSAAKNGLTNVVPLTDSTQYVVDATNYMKFTAKRKVGGLIHMTAAIANWVRGGYRRVGQRNYSINRIGLDQTGVFTSDKLIRADTEIPAEKRLEYQADNGNNAQVEAGLFFLTEGGKLDLHETSPNDDNDLHYIDVISATAAVGGSWTNVTSLTFSETFEADAEYIIKEFSAHSATGYAARIVYPGAINQDMRPGVPMGDTPGVSRKFRGQFGSFKGSAPPTFDVLASGNDAAQYFTLGVKRRGGRR